MMTERPNKDSNLEVFLAETNLLLKQFQGSLKNLEPALNRLQSQIIDTEKDVIRLQALEPRLIALEIQLGEVTRNLEKFKEDTHREVGRLQDQLSKQSLKQLQEMHTLDKDVAHEKGRASWIYLIITAIGGAALGGLVTNFFKKL